MYNQRKVKIIKKPLFQGDSGVETFTFEFDKYYNELDLSKLSAYLKLTYPDDSGDVIKLTTLPQDDESVILLSWVAEGKNTQVAGEILAQILFENDESTVVLNSEVFNIEIKNSVNSTMLSLGGSTQVEILLSRVNGKIDEINKFLNSKIVSSVNGLSGDVTLSAKSLNAPTVDELNEEIDKLKSGEYTAKKAECDASGNDITSNYVKKSDLQWTQVAYSIIPQDSEIELSLGGRYKELFALMEIPFNLSEPNTPVSTRIETKIGSSYVIVYDTEESDLTLYSETYHVSFKFNMCANFAKVEKQQASLDTGDAIGLVAKTTIGKDIGQSFIDNLRIRFFDESGNEIYSKGGAISVYGLKQIG